MNLINKNQGSALVTALIFAIVLAVIGGSTLTLMNNRYLQANQTATWQDALSSAESGIDTAVNELRKGIYAPSTAWSGWTKDSTGNLKFTTNVVLREGEGGNRSWAEITVDTPSYLKDSSGEQWYRVKSLGIAELSGRRYVAGNDADLNLRKYDLNYDRRKNGTVSNPRATRMVESIIKPVGAFRLALLAGDKIDMNNHNIVVDSYDSREPGLKSNASGFYDVLKRQENGDIATNGILIDAGSAHIYGDASTNGGTVLNSSNITGEIRSDFYQELFDVNKPTLNPNSTSVPSSITKGVVLQANEGTPSNYSFTTVKLTASEKMLIKGVAGKETYINILVNGEVSLSGSSQIVLEPNVFVRFFVTDDTNFSGNGISNPGSPINMQIYGVKNSSNPTIKVAGNGGIRASVYAPSYNVDLVGGGTTDSIFGAFVGNQIRMTGIQAVHYDEALGDTGLISDFKMVSWFEDTR